MPEDYKLDGELWADYRAKCSRCLKDIESKMHIDVKENFVEEGSNKTTRNIIRTMVSSSSWKR